MDLVERRAAVMRRHKTLASVSGSGFHKDDPGEVKRAARGDMALCDRVVALSDDDRVHVVGECADRVRKALAEYVEKKPKTTYTGLDTSAMRVAVRVLATTGDISLHPQEWNSCNFALNLMKVICVLADANNVPEEEV